MEDKLAAAAAELFVRHGDRLPWIAVTNGGLPSYLFSREFLAESGSLSSFWRYTYCCIASFVRCFPCFALRQSALTVRW